MPMAIVVTRNLEARYRGFLTSIMLEVGPGVYVAPNLSASVRTRVWDVLSDWWATLGSGSIVLVWGDANAAGGLRIATLGEPPKEIVDADGILLVRRGLDAAQLASRSLKSLKIQ